MIKKYRGLIKMSVNRYPKIERDLYEFYNKTSKATIMEKPSN